jgi:DNA-binding transcriptional LysR family regulator
VRRGRVGYDGIEGEGDVEGAIPALCRLDHTLKFRAPFVGSGSDDRNIDLVEVGVDVALRMGSLTDSTLTARKIGQGGRFVLGTPSNFAKRGEPESPADLVSHQAVIYDQRGGGAPGLSDKARPRQRSP